MKLRSLRVNQFKMFMEPHCIGDIGDSLNVVAGPNEIGKSTVFDALRAALFETHSASGKWIRALQNDRSQGAPQVELVFECDEGTYVLTKKFLSAPLAQLRCPDGAVLAGSAAEERLRSLFKFSGAVRGAASPESMGTWDVLWVKQGDSISNPGLSESARATLSDIVQSAATETIGGRQGRALLRTMTEQHNNVHTPTHRLKAGGRLKNAIDRVAELERQLEKLKTRQQETEQNLQSLNAAAEQLRQLNAGNLDSADKAELEKKKAELAGVEAYETNLGSAETERENCELKFNDAQRKQDERLKGRDELRRESEQLQSEKETLTEQQDKLKAKTQQINVFEVAAFLILEERLREAEAVESRMVEAEGAAASILATDEAYQRVRDAQSELSDVAAQLRAAATRITFAIDGVRQPEIQVDGRALTDVLRDETQPLQRVVPMGIDIAGIGRIHIDPNVGNPQDLLQRHEQADMELRSALSASDADSLEDARQKNLQRRGYLDQAQIVHNALAKLAPDGIEVLRNEVEARRDSLTDLPPDVWSEARDIPRSKTGESINDQITKLKVEESELRVLYASADKAVRERVEKIETQERDLKQTELVASDDQLASNVAAAKQAFITAVASYELLEAQRPEIASAELKQQIEEVESGLKSRGEQRNELRIKVAKLSDRLDRDEATGIAEEVVSTENDLEQEQREVTRLEREVTVIDLLIDTLIEAENDARNQYLEPVLQNVLPYLQRLFPDSAIGIDNNLNITEVTRDASRVEPFVNLSMGTQEQIAVLVRLGLAKLLSEKGTPVVVVLDDALIYSDDVRMRLMFDILTEAARDVQILVFTCREQLFEGLDAHRLQIARCDTATQPAS